LKYKYYRQCHQGTPSNRIEEIFINIFNEILEKKYKREEVFLMLNFDKVRQTDEEVYNSIIAEYERQQNGIELIASENRPSEAVLQAQSSYHTLKYAEGYPRK